MTRLRTITACDASVAAERNVVPFASPIALAVDRVRVTDVLMQAAFDNGNEAQSVSAETQYLTAVERLTDKLEGLGLDRKTASQMAGAI
ncbi:hypothetical protein HME9302_00948 [Alteripontixanthobacter maritimus]|uniref:Uncharacterized protein n=1 Tax=Alteripontixanthobacter maritimus TaxID=2161824 RepID=A0A369Q4D6_9SPHN|nr:hypothetical protein [Alteripontixanthobacter maritimus]RDC59753.1 hypothetical protein HME9302_00948 [Alteripontixanthobacter maritimus]